MWNTARTCKLTPASCCVATPGNSAKKTQLRANNREYKQEQGLKFAAAWLTSLREAVSDVKMQALSPQYVCRRHLSEFADDIKLGGCLHLLEGR